MDAVTHPTTATGRPERTRVYLDLTHLGRHVTGIERIAIEQFEKVDFTGAEVIPVRSAGTLSLIFKQQVLLPLLALLHPHALFAFPGFPPSPLLALFAPSRIYWYIHDLFLITRRADLGTKARLYMAPPFAFAVKRLRHFQVNSEKTATELAPFVRTDADVRLYRPSVRNIFNLTAAGRAARTATPRPLKIATLGTVEPRKNYGAAPPILDELEKLGFPGAQLHVIGREGWGDAKAALQNHPRVTIHGYLEAAQVKALLEDADLYLCTSHDEGLGLPLLEAQYAGLPVVAPQKAVFREVLDNSGIFIDPADPAAAAATISAVLHTPYWRETTATAAVANVARWNEAAASDTRSAAQMFAPDAKPHSSA